MNSTVTEKAVVGRRITLTYYRDLPDGPAHPGIVTLVTSDKASVMIRLDGKRYNVPASVDFPGITYLDEVVPVPALPMGRFTPTEPSDDDGFLDQDGVLLATIGEDGEDLILIAEPGEKEKALAAASAYLSSVGVDIGYVNFDGIRPCWAVFEWRAEDALSPWSIRWDAAEGDDQAVHIYHLPA